MYTRPSARRGKKLNALINPKSHVQKKYFSLMLVPSYSYGKTRSLRIPYGVFYFIVISILAVTAVILGFYLYSNYLAQVAHNYSLSLDEAQEAYQELQETSENEQSRLMDDFEQLNSQLTEEQIRNQSERYRQRQDYQDTLNYLQEQIDDLETQLRELDKTRQEVLSQLGAKAYIPPIANMLKEMNSAQEELLAGVSFVSIRSDERSASANTTVADLEDYYALLTARLQIQLSCFNNLNAYVKKIGPYVTNYPTRWPVRGIVSSVFGYRNNPMGGSGGDHHGGIDIRCPVGTSVRATGGGVVRQSGWGGSYGYIVVIDHGFGIQTAYAHNSANLVKVGQQVKRGDVIARAGSTGRSTGPHVHYEVRVNGVAVNPTKYFLET